MALILSNETDASTDRLGVTVIKAVYHADSFMEALTGMPDSPIAELPFIDRQVTQAQSGRYSAILNYEGILPGTDPKDDFFEVEGSTSEDPIEAHPDIEKLMKYYEGTEIDGRVTFPRLLESDRRSSTFVGPGAPIRNPLFGASAYYTSGIIWARSRVVKELPESFVINLGKIDTPPDAPDRQPPTLPGKRNWLKIRAVARWRGNIWQANEAWLISGDGGWNEDVYALTED